MSCETSGLCCFSSRTVPIRSSQLDRLKGTHVIELLNLLRRIVKGVYREVYALGIVYSLEAIMYLRKMVQCSTSNLLLFPSSWVRLLSQNVSLSLWVG